MEYKLSPFSHLETQALTPGMRQNLPFTHMFPPNDFQLHHLCNSSPYTDSLISNLYQEQQTTKEELKTVKEELTILKDRLNVQEQEKQQEES